MSDISIRGWIESERVANPPIYKLIAELLHNSLEVIRLAKEKHEIDAKIEIKCVLDSHMIPLRLEISDYATGFTGFKNLADKKAFRLYEHIGTRSGFSGYGIGGKFAAMLIGNKIEFNTICNSLSETMVWNVNKAITYDSLYESLEYYDNDPWFTISEPFKTGTMVSISEFTDKYRNIETGNYMVSEFIYDISNQFIRLDKSIPITYKVIADSETIVNEYILPQPIQGNRKRVFNLAMIKHKTLGNTASYIYDDSTDSFYTFYNNQKKDNFTKEKPIVLVMNDKYEKLAEIKLVCKMDTMYSKEKTGFYTLRNVEGGYTIRTNPKPLRLKWKKMMEHPILTGYFRGIIEYDKSADMFLQSDKFKSTSDDRSFEPSLRFNILKLINNYALELPEEISDETTDKIIEETIEEKVEYPQLVFKKHRSKTNDSKKLVEFLIEKIDEIPSEKYPNLVQLLINTNSHIRSEVLEFQYNILLDKHGIRPILDMLYFTYDKFHSFDHYDILKQLVSELTE